MSLDALLKEMSQDLGIEKSLFESEKEWRQRILLSASSAWVLENIRNIDNNSSITLMKRKLRETVFAYLGLFQPLEKLDTEEMVNDTVKNIVEYVFDIHVTIGSVYHKAYYLYPAREQIHIIDGIQFYRSPVNPEKLKYSGMGTYRHFNGEKENREEYLEKFYDCYLLPREKPEDFLKQLKSNRTWNKQEPSSSNVEYLNISRKQGEAYYTNKKPFNLTALILAREEFVFGEHRYSLSRDDLQYTLQEWEQEESIHEYIALVLMRQYKEMCARVIIDKNLVNLKLDYALPKPEEKFLRLYSWPCSLDKLDNRWNFCMPPAIYNVMKKRLSHLGFTIKESFV